MLENLVLMKHQMYTRKPALNVTSNVYLKTCSLKPGFREIPNVCSKTWFQ